MQSPRLRLRTFADHPCTGDAVVLAATSYLRAGHSSQLQFVDDQELILKSQVQLEGVLAKGLSNRFVTFIHKNEITVCNIEAEIFKVANIQLSRLGPYEKVKKELLKDSNEVPSQIYKILENYLNIDSEPLSLFDSKLLQQLLQMGFDENASKEALIQSNNQLENAIEILSAPQSWKCASCTLINKQSKDVCEACEMERVYTAENDASANQEVQIQQPAADDRIIIEEDEKINQEYSAIIEQQPAEKVLQIHIERNQTPIIIASVHGNHVVSLKKLGYSEDYLAQFFQKQKEGYYCQITNQWNEQLDYGSLFQGDSISQIIETLIPLYGQNVKQKNVQLQVRDHKAVAVEQPIIDIDYAVVFDITYLFILTRTLLHIYEIALSPWKLSLKTSIPVEQVDNLISNRKEIVVYGTQFKSLDTATWTLLNVEPFQSIQVSGEKFLVTRGGKVEDLHVSHLTQLKLTPQLLSSIQECIDDQPIKVCHLYVTDDSKQQIQLDSSIISYQVKAIFSSSTTPKISPPQQQILAPSHSISEPKLLSVTVHSFKGAQFNNSTFVTSMLFKSNKPFTSNYPNAEFIFQHCYSSSMLVDHVIVKSDTTNASRGFPIGAGLIFTSCSADGFEGSGVFDGMEKDDYANWRAYRTTIPYEFEEWEPVGCFELEGSELEVKCKLDLVRPCNFILLKPTNFRKQPYNQTTHFPQNSVEIRQVLFYGTECKDAAAINRYRQSQGLLSDALKKRINLEVASEVYESLVLSRRVARYRERQDCELDIPNDGQIEFQVSSRARELVIEPLNNQEWRLSEIEIYGRKCKSQYHADLRQILLDDEEYEKLNRQLVEQLYNSDVEIRNKAMKILIITMKNQKICEKVKKDLDLYQFIIMNVLPQDLNQSVAIFIQIIQTLLKDKIFEVASRIFTEIRTLKITETGLEIFISLLKYACDKPEIGSLCYDTFKQTLKQLLQLGDHKYKDPYIFSTKYNQISSTYNPEGPREIAQEVPRDSKELRPLYCQSDPLSQILLVSYSPKYQIRTFQVYLLGEFLLSKLQIRFQKCINAVGFRIQIWNQQNLIMDREYADWLFVQFTQFNESTPCLQIPLNTQTRYLKVQFTFGSPVIQCKQQMIQQIPQNELVVIPEFYGALVDNQPVEPKLEGNFRYKTTILFGDTLYYAYQSDKQLLLDSYNVYSKVKASECQIVMANTQSKRNTEHLEQSILQLQADLCVKQKNGLPIKHLEQLIESTQVELLRTSQPRSFDQNQNFLTTFSCNLIQLLREISFTPNVDWEILEILIALGDRGLLTEWSFGYLGKHLNKAETILKSYAFIPDHEEILQKLLKTLKIPILETLTFMLNSKDQNVQDYLYEILVYHLRNPQFEVLEDPNPENQEILSLAFTHIFDDTKFRINLLLLVLQRCAATQIKAQLTEEKLLRLTESGLQHQEKFKKLLETLFQVRVMQTKYIDWSALQFLDERQKALVEAERNALKYVSKFILYFYQQHIQQNVEKMPMDHLLLLFDFLSTSISKLNKDTRLVDKKQRKKGEGQQVSQFEDFLHRQHLQICSSKTVQKLIDLLQNETSQKVWSKVLKVILMMNPSQLNEERLYEKVISAFKSQNLMQQNEIFQFSISLASQELQQSATCSQMFQALIPNLPQHSDVFIAVSELVKQVKISHLDQIVIALAGYLEKTNIGGKDGVQCASVELILNLELITAFLNIIIQSEVTCPSLENLPEEPLSKIVTWYCFNSSINVQQSPSQHLLQRITQQLDAFFDLFPQKTVLLKLYFNNLKLIDQLVQSPSVSYYTAYNTSNQISEAVKSKFEKFLNQDQIAKDVAFSTDAFNYLIAKIISDKKKPEIAQPTAEEEFGAKVKVVNLPGQNQPHVADWSINKKGVKSRVALLPLPTTMRGEYQLILSLDQEIDLKSIKLGVQTYTADFTDKILGTPQSILLEAGLSQEELQPVKEMHAVNDEIYSNYQTKVYCYNACNSNELIPQQQPVKVLCFRFRSPVVQMLDDLSTWAVKSCKKVCIGISFISITGHDAKHRLSKKDSIMQLQEKTSLELLCKLCRPNFDQTLQSLANDISIIQRIQSSFHKFMQALVSHSYQLSPLILAISKYNQVVGDWIIEQLMNPQSELSHAKLLTEVILSSKDVVSRLVKLHNYMLPKLLALNAQNNKSQDLVQFQKLAPFIDSYTTVLLLSAKNSKQAQRSIEIPVNKDDIIHLLSLFEMLNQQSTHYLLIRLIVNLTYLPHPYVQVEEVDQILTFAWNKAELNPEYMEILTPLTLGSNAGIEWILKQLPIIVNKLFKALNEGENQIFIKTCARFLQQIVYNNRCSQSLLQYLLPLYDSLMNRQTSILKPIEESAIVTFTSFFSQMLQKYQTKFLIEALIKDVQLLKTISDMNFAKLVLLPLLNGEEEVRMALTFKDEELFIADPRQVAAKVVQGDLSLIVVNQESPKLETQILTGEQMGQLLKELKHKHWARVAFQKNDGDSSMIPVLSDKFLSDEPNMLMLSYRRNGEEGVFGIANSTKLRFNIQTSGDNLYEYEGNEQTLIFSFQGDKFRTLKPGKDFSAHLDIYDGQGTFVFEVSGKTFLMLEYVEGESSHLGLEVLSMTERPQNSFLLESVKVEYFVQRNPVPPQLSNTSVTLPVLQHCLGTIQQLFVSAIGYSDLSHLILPEQFYDRFAALNYYSVTPIYNLPANMKASQLKKLLTLNKYPLKEASTLLDSETPLKDFPSNEYGFIELAIDSRQFLEDINLSTKQAKLSYQQQMAIFPIFEELEGVQVIIEVIKAAIQRWQNQNRAKAWLQFVDELQSFCHLPNFFKLFMKNQQCVTLLFDLLAGSPDLQEANKQKKWEEEEQNAVKFIYCTLVNVFSSQNTPEIRIKAIEKNLIQHILDRIAQVSKENKRTNKPLIDPPIEKQQKDGKESEKVENAATSGQASKKAQTNAKGKKGIGYASDNTGQNQKWNTTEYVERRNQKSQQLINLLGIVESFFDIPNWHPSEAILQQLLNTVFESALLPLLESAFRSASLLEISKEFDLYQGYLNIVKAISKHQKLAPIFLPISTLYVPPQSHSIQELLQKMTDTARVFLNGMSNNKQKKGLEDQTNTAVANLIIETYRCVDECISKHQTQTDREPQLNENQIKDSANQLIQVLLKKPLQESYRALLQDLRFDYIDMKVVNRYKHHYQVQIQPNHTPPTAKIVRLAQEFADMSSSLPIEHTNAIFVRADKERVDVLKALVMGAKGTPYAHGAFLFDIFVDDNYPNGPPKMNLATTGGGKVRFNPNLYSCGKVCLSLLGTWRGNASENWDPKLSTLLQVLVSTQAIIMSEEVYFNEPGFEQESGTDEGDKKNEAYSNIVRYGNIKYAMIDQIRDPPKGFESIIKRHFYLKKEEILEDVRKWVTQAETKEALYTGLIHDHNQLLSNEFKKDKKSYAKKLTEAVKELEIELNKLQPPSAEDLEGTTVLRTHIKNQPKAKNIQDGMANLEDVDVTYEQSSNVKQFSAEDASVMDRWSRYIGAMGMDAVKKQAGSSILISGMGPLGIEIAKNIVLSGVKQLTIHDDVQCRAEDLNGQFFLTTQDIGKNRAEQSLNKLQQLNSYVLVQASSQNLDELLPKVKDYQMIILAKTVTDNQLGRYSEFCRAHKIKLIYTSVDGVFARLWNDFGEDFVVEDKSGEQSAEIVLKSITSSNPGQITLLPGTKHELQDGDLIFIDNVDGMQLLTDPTKSINKTPHKITKVVTQTVLEIDDTSMYLPHLRNGTIKLLKLPVQLSFKPLPQLISDPVFDPQMREYDFTKYDTLNILHSLYTNQPTNHDPKYDGLVQQFTKFAVLGEFPPLAAFLGGFAAQEAIKALTNKFMPVHQMLYFDCTEVLPKEETPNTSELARFVGEEVAAKIAAAKVFMIGCGAIGCELLKNFAMIDLGVNGALTITDPDHIEVSNLNRQFLFREKHIRKPKSSTAAAAVIQMNPKLKSHVIARLDKVYDGTEHIFTDAFFEEQTLVANALDNVAARRYVDRRCVDAKIPLLESGTLGPKGHVQCILPYLTESYGSQNDPVEEGEIPYCTLKMFPEETFHCVEFARDKFGKLFTIRPKAVQKILDSPDYQPQSSEDNKVLREAIKLFKHRPLTHSDCITWARRKFQKYFTNDIKQLLYTYPLDAKTKDGNLFWTMPKRPPVSTSFDPENALHQQFVATFAYLRAKMFGIKCETNWRSKEMMLQTAQEAAKQTFPEWQPSEEKRKNIAQQVQKNETKEQHEDNEEEVSTQQETQNLYEEFKKLKQENAQLKMQLFSEEFEKDDDQNGHIDFIHSFGNLRAGNYKLEPMDWLTVKLKAGRIVPALATTTAVVAGLQTIELIKTIKKVPLDQMKSAFVNLAVPFVQLTEPGAVPKIKLNERTTVTLWDRWEVRVDATMTLQDLFSYCQREYGLWAKDVFVKGAPVYMEMMMKKKPAERAQMLESKLAKVLNGDQQSKYLDLTINFTLEEEGQEIVKNVPNIRLVFE